MDFLNPALFIGLAGALFLSGINIYLYSHDREKYLLTWAISWVVYSLRLILQLLSARFGPSNYLILGEMFLSGRLAGTDGCAGPAAFTERLIHHGYPFVLKKIDGRIGTDFDAEFAA